jgi:PadR family transcriptional regulator, regulatory protein PadR
MGILYHERHYGYSLVRVLSESGFISLKEGKIYPIPARLDRDGLLRSEWVESDQGPPRKYCTLTSSGGHLFDALSQEFDVLASLIHHKWKAAALRGCHLRAEDLSYKRRLHCAAVQIGKASLDLGATPPSKTGCRPERAALHNPKRRAS